MRALALALFALTFSAPAFAGYTVVHSGPSVSVHVDPWNPAWRPAARAGYVWTNGYYVGNQWAPGYWAPASARYGYDWVPGYWDGYNYVDGYWRPVQRVGYAWSGGYYHHNVWVPGAWSSQTRVVNTYRAPQTVVYRSSRPAPQVNHRVVYSAPPRSAPHGRTSHARPR